MANWKHVGVLAIALSSLGGCAFGDERTDSSASAQAEQETYPIVLAHGFFGFEDFAGLAFINYHWKVKEHLASKGERLVFTPAVDPFNSSEHRGKQLLAHVEKILQQTGARKVNIIGHSQGGLDARYVAHVRPDLVASVTTYATPNNGMPLSDIALGLVDSPVVGPVVDFFVQLLGGPLWDEVGNETSLAASVRQFSTPAIREFNAKYTDVPGIPYFSIAGRTALSLGGDVCEKANAPPFIRRWENERDTTEPLFKPVELIIGGWARVPNDGLVLVESTPHGEFLGCVPADHLDQIGHLFGGSPGWFNDWNHLDFYADLVAFLRARGL